MAKKKFLIRRFLFRRGFTVSFKTREELFQFFGLDKWDNRT